MLSPRVIAAAAFFGFAVFTAAAESADAKTSTAAPAGMVWIPGGEFSMGTDDPTKMSCGGTGHDPMPDARPIHRVAVDGFWMDATEVTNEQFERFVNATGYVTIAERKPKPEDFPGAPPEALVPGSIVFTPTPGPVPLDDYLAWWRYEPGASWRHPEGPKSDLNGREKLPVVHVSHEDAAAYAKWAGKRLPTEAVWEWCADWYRPDYYEQLAKAGVVARNPQGPPESFDPSEPGVPKRVQRGGS